MHTAEMCREHGSGSELSCLRDSTTDQAPAGARSESTVWFNNCFFACANLPQLNGRIATPDIQRRVFTQSSSRRPVKKCLLLLCFFPCSSRSKHYRPWAIIPEDDDDMPQWNHSMRHNNFNPSGPQTGLPAQTDQGTTAEIAPDNLSVSFYLL